MGNQVWGLSGDRDLVDGDRAIRKGTGTPNRSLATGFLRTNADVEWSFPTGKRVLAGTATGRLVNREAAGANRLDIFLLATHGESVYHPGGTQIASVGVVAATPGGRVGRLRKLDLDRGADLEDP